MDSSEVGDHTDGPAGVGPVRLLNDTDVSPAAALLARAFLHDPVAAAALPDPADRQRVTARFMAHEVRASLAGASSYGIEVSGVLAGVAIWYPPGLAPRSLPATLRLATELLAETPTVLPAVPRLLVTLVRDSAVLGRLVTKRQVAFRRAGHPPATYLALLATDPDHRGRGLARQLLDHVLPRCDADGLAVWLHTTDPTNLGFYARFGFACSERIPGGRVLPDLWVLRREAPTTRRSGHAHDG